MPDSKAGRAEADSRQPGVLGKGRAFLRILGPGLFTRASDDDPSGIGTCAQCGARFGYAPLWLALYSLPPMICVGLLLIANTVNIGADLRAMAAAGQMLIRAPLWLCLLVITAALTAAIVVLSYRRYASLLRYFCLSLLAYVLVLAVVRQGWGVALNAILIPRLHETRDEALNVVAILGTTISPYLFFWQASQEVEENIEEGKTSPAARRGVSAVELKWRRADVSAGMFASNLIMACIIMPWRPPSIVMG